MCGAPAVADAVAAAPPLPPSSFPYGESEALALWIEPKLALLRCMAPPVSASSSSSAAAASWGVAAPAPAPAVMAADATELLFADESLGVRLGSVPDPNRPPVMHEGRCEVDLGPEAPPGPILVSLVEWSVTANLRFAPDE